MNEPRPIETAVPDERRGRPEPAEERLRRIIDTMADAVVVVDREGIVEFVNPAGEELFGRAREEVIGDHFGLPLSGAETAEVDLTDGRVAEMRVVDVDWNGTPAWLASLRDVTARREAEAAERRLWRERYAREQAERERLRLEDLTERLRAEERAKDQFLAVLGHELRNPLAGISNGLQLLERGIDADPRSRTLDMMRKQVTVLAGLLDDLFDVSAIARGKLELQRERIEVRGVVDSAVAAVHGRLEERGQRLSVDLPDEPLAVEGDLRRLEQILANLLVNASKYSDPGTGIELRVRREAGCEDDGGEAVLEVADHGAGISEDMLERIFDAFVQSPSGAPVAGGLGIGLTLVRQLVELHGGTVEAASEGPGEGSTFTVRIPVAAPPGEATAETTAETAADPAGDPAAACDGRRVLVVDDNRDAGGALAELLALHGCATETAETGGDGLAKARSWRPDVVLLDLDLPDMTGYDVAAALRAEPEHDGLLLVAVSGYGPEQKGDHTQQSRIDHHLVKPVDLDELIRIVGRPEAGSE